MIIAADALPEGQSGGYDEPEPEQAWEAYQDYRAQSMAQQPDLGRRPSRCLNLRSGRIWGRGLTRSNDPKSQNPANRRTSGVGNKAISLKNCRNVQLRDFQILQAGWFGILATGVDNLLIDGLTIDTNRDGMDIDCCRNVRVANCAINSPWDDAIVPKSSYALGYARATGKSDDHQLLCDRGVRTGNDAGRHMEEIRSVSKGSSHGRIKFGTESNGGFKNITVSNCVFEGCQGLALETVDGALLEDMAITNITMRDLVSAPIFLRLGSRLRGPAESTKTGTLQRVILSNIVCSNAASQLGCIISGVPGTRSRIRSSHHIYIQHRGGGTKDQAAVMPAGERTEVSRTEYVWGHAVAGLLSSTREERDDERYRDRCDE